MMDALMAEVDDQQIELHIKFANLRHGIPDGPPSDRQIAKARRDKPTWTARPPRDFRPRPGPAAMFAYLPRGVRVEEAAAAMDERVLYQAGSARARLARRVVREGTKTVNQAVRFLFPMNFRFYRTLGWGGEGVAALLYLVDGSPLGRRVVAKMSLSEQSTGFANERDISTRFKGQYHMLQRLFGPDLMPGNPAAAAQMDQALQAAESRLMLFEFAEFGSLQSLLKKVSNPVRGADDPLGLRATQGEPLPNRALMHVFHCLATACEDMKAPAKGPGGVPSRPVVHFDLEPSNLLFDGITGPNIEEGHKMMPILKVGDYGLSSALPDSLAQETLWGWDKRWKGKTRQYLPEQFSQDWDYCVKNPVAENIDTYGQVAGHYGPASNVYHVGLTMWCCITGVWAELPTYSRLAESPIARRDGIAWWTWWADILDDSKYGRVDRQLRETVLACLAEEPRRRIDSSALLAWCSTRIAQLRLQPGASDADLLDWALANMTAPPEPPVGTPMPGFDPTSPDDDQIEPFEPRWCL